MRSQASITLSRTGMISVGLKHSCHPSVLRIPPVCKNMAVTWKLFLTKFKFISMSIILMKCINLISTKYHNCLAILNTLMDSYYFAGRASVLLIIIQLVDLYPEERVQSYTEVSIWWYFVLLLDRCTHSESNQIYSFIFLYFSKETTISEFETNNTAPLAKKTLVCTYN